MELTANRGDGNTSSSEGVCNTVRNGGFEPFRGGDRDFVWKVTIDVAGSVGDAWLIPKSPSNDREATGLRELLHSNESACRRGDLGISMR